MYLNNKSFFSQLYTRNLFHPQNRIIYYLRPTNKPIYLTVTRWELGFALWWIDLFTFCIELFCAFKGTSPPTFVSWFCIAKNKTKINIKKGISIRVISYGIFTCAIFYVDMWDCLTNQCIRVVVAFFVHYLLTYCLLFYIYTI